MENSAATELPQSPAVPQDAEVIAAKPVENPPAVHGEIIRDAEEMATRELTKWRQRKSNVKINPEKMLMIERLLSGDYEGERGKYIRECWFTDREKSFIINDPRFREIYDAVLFDWLFLGKLPSKEIVRIFEILSRRLGVWKGVTINASNSPVMVKIKK